MRNLALRVATFVVFFLVIFPQREAQGYAPNFKSSDVHIDERTGEIENFQLREKGFASHLYVDSSHEPYAFFAFPAGNSGAAVWFATPAHLHVSAQGLHTASEPRGFRGGEAEITSDVERLVITDVVLGSMRFIRDRELGAAIPAEARGEKWLLRDGGLRIDRTSLNGLIHDRLELRPAKGTTISRKNEKFEVTSSTRVRFKLIGLTTERSPTPLSPADFFTPAALEKINPRQAEAFSFLTTKEKLMAGSPRYLSKFGRDSLMVLTVLMDAMKPAAVEDILRATLSSANPLSAAISHEQSEGDFASYDRLTKGQPTIGISAPLEDYKMLDENYLFTVAVSRHLLRFPGRAKAFLDSKEARGLLVRTLVKAGFRRTLDSARAFARDPIFSHLIHIQAPETVGQWRDSENGLGGGIYPYDVNVALVPGALASIRDLAARRGTEFFDEAAAGDAAALFDVWNSKAASLFKVRVSHDDAVRLAEIYRTKIGLPASALGPAPAGDLIFSAISLDETGRPIPVMHSDDAMTMVFGEPTVETLTASSALVRDAFPFGLFTPAGILVANPTFAAPSLQEKFTESNYHGRVSWTMQEHLLKSGFDRALARKDLSSPLRQQIQAASETIAELLKKKSALGGTEVFTIKFTDGKFVATPFAGDAKANSNQLWSHLGLIRDRN